MSADNQQERPKRLNPWYITGFTEGEGTFHVAIYKDSAMKNKVKVIPEFHLNQSYLRIETLDRVKEYFGCGYIKANHQKNSRDTTFVYVVRKREDLIKKIIPFFLKYPLISNKQETFILFKEVVEMMDKGLHGQKKFLVKILEKAYAMNGNSKNRRKRKIRI